ncbi:MAG: AAA family ATPase [Nitrospiraceae bacterium]|nr:AAA family ATPase [Nitrospiraceae bacterium]
MTQTEELDFETEEEYDARVRARLKEIDEEYSTTPLIPRDESLSDEVIRQFEELSRTEDMLEYWYPAINPKVVGMENIKRAVLLSMASLGDRYGDRGRIHVLLYGDPGTAKTLITDWLIFHQGAVGASMRSSRVGLTADARGDEITLGSLPKANNHIICLDEMDKFDQKSLQGLLEALEEGKIHIDVGKTHSILDARVRCIACANDTSKFAPELMDRFDFKFKVLKPDPEFKRKIMQSRVMNWFRQKEDYDGLNLRNYLKWISDFEPEISDDVRVAMAKLMEMYLVLTESEGSIRAEESLIRIAVTLAKLHHRDVMPGDLLRAIRMKNPLLNNGKMELLEKLLLEE